MIKYELRQIDAWADPEGGWTYNETFHLDEYFISKEATHQDILNALRGPWIYEDASFESFVFEEDGNGMIEICLKDDGCPIFCLIPLEHTEEM